MWLAVPSQEPSRFCWTCGNVLINQGTITQDIAPDRQGSHETQSGSPDLGGIRASPMFGATSVIAQQNLQRHPMCRPQKSSLRGLTGAIPKT
jgi:hypothetical protein